MIFLCINKEDRRSFRSSSRAVGNTEKRSVRDGQTVVNSESFPWAVHLAVLSISQDKNTTVLTCVVRGKMFTKKLNTES